MIPTIFLQNETEEDLFEKLIREVLLKSAIFPEKFIEKIIKRLIFNLAGPKVDPNEYEEMGHELQKWKENKQKSKRIANENDSQNHSNPRELDREALDIMMARKQFFTDLNKTKKELEKL